MKYILSGQDTEVAKVLQENRIRVDRGLISFTPVDPYSDTKEVSPSDSKDVSEDSKTVTPDDSKDVSEDANSQVKKPGKRSSKSQ